MAQELIEVGENDKQLVTPLNKELYDLANEVMFDDGMSRNGAYWHIGKKDIAEFINELEKRYDITPKQER